MSWAETYPLEAGDPYCLDPEVAADMLDNGLWERYVVVGDSVAAGIREPRDGYLDRCFADRLADALASTRPELAWANLGIRDLRVPEIRRRQLPTALAFEPDLAMVVAGGNDALARSFDPDRLREELRALVRPLAESGALVVTVGLFDLARSGLLPDQVAETMVERFDLLDELTAAVAVEVGGVHVDTHHHPLGASPDIYASDRIHGNARGHAVAFAAVVEQLAQVASRDPARHA
jgi:lysophospholipase L1-like esterase